MWKMTEPHPLREKVDFQIQTTSGIHYLFEDFNIQNHISTLTLNF